MELLLTNLINNSIRHNWENGELKVSLTSATFTIENTGDKLEIEPNSLFERFRKPNQSTQSMGLEMAIVKKIGDLYQYKINYTQTGKTHTLRINF